MLDTLSYINPYSTVPFFLNTSMAAPDLFAKLQNNPEKNWHQVTQVLLGKGKEDNRKI